MALPSAEPRSDRATPTAAPVRAVTNVSASSRQNEAFGGLDDGVPTILYDEGLLGELCSDDETDDGGNWRPQWRGSDTDGDTVGVADGVKVGATVGLAVGLSDGLALGDADGVAVGV